MKSNTTTRRDFIRHTAAGAAMAAPWIIPSRATGDATVAAPSERITLGVIGMGPRCKSVLPQMLSHPDVQCVAMADVQGIRRRGAKRYMSENHPEHDCAFYRDFRELLDRDDIDAVFIATGDRWHAPASILAAQAGKDVYSEKPCGITIAACEQLAATIRETGSVFQAGTQRRSLPNFEQAVGLAHSGKLGTLRTLHASVYRPVMNNAWLPGEPTPDPDDVDWNLWLGPAPWRPYNSAYVQGQWRGYYDFDSGAKLLDWGAHTVDLCQWANQADDTMPLVYEPGEDRITARYENGVELILHFLDTPFGERPGFAQELGTCPVRFEGDEGWVEAGDSGGIEVHPASLRGELPGQLERESGLDVKLHTRDFFDAIKTRGTTRANADVMRHSHLACHAAALSWILGRKLEIDPAKGEFINDDEANRLRSRPARDWTA